MPWTENPMAGKQMLDVAIEAPLADHTLPLKVLKVD